MTECLYVILTCISQVFEVKLFSVQYIGFRIANLVVKLIGVLHDTSTKTG